MGDVGKLRNRLKASSKTLFKGFLGVYTGLSMKLLKIELKNVRYATFTSPGT